MLVNLPKPAPLSRVLTQMRLYQASHGIQWPSLRALARAANVSHAHVPRLIKKAAELGLAEPVYKETTRGKKLVGCRVVLDRNVERGLAWAHQVKCDWGKPIAFTQRVGGGFWLDRALFNLRQYQGKRTKSDPMPLVGRPDAQVWAVQFTVHEPAATRSELDLGPSHIAIVHLVPPDSLPKKCWCLVEAPTQTQCCFVTRTRWGYNVRRSSSLAEKSRMQGFKGTRFVAVIGRVIRVMPMPSRLGG